MYFAFSGRSGTHICHAYPASTQILPNWLLAMLLLPMLWVSMVWTFTWWPIAYSSDLPGQTITYARGIRTAQASPAQRSLSLSLSPSQSSPQASVPITVQPTALITETQVPTVTSTVAPTITPTNSLAVTPGAPLLTSPILTPTLATTPTISQVIIVTPSPTQTAIYSLTTPSATTISSTLTLVPTENPPTITVPITTLPVATAPAATVPVTIVPIAILSHTISTPTLIVSPTLTVSATAIPTATMTPTVLPSETPAPTLMITPTRVVTETPVVTVAPTLPASATPLPTLSPTATEVPTETPTEIPTEVPTETPTAVATYTPLPSSTSTHTPLPTATPTHTPEWVGTPGLSSAETCADAIPIHYNGAVHRQTFSTLQEPEWFRFEATAGVTYLIEATTQADSEMADLRLELYDDCYDKEPITRQNFPFTRDVRFKHQAATTARLYLKVTDTEANHSKRTRGYNLSVYSTEYVPDPGALIIVSGVLQEGDPQQKNIDRLVEEFHDLYHGAYDADNIMLLSPSKLNQRSSTRLQSNPSKQALREAITQWAPDRVGGNRPFTLYIADHGEPDRLYLDKPNNEWITPDELDDWLEELEEEMPGVVINVIIESSNSGSFITGRESISRAGRMIITSASEEGQAYSTSDGAIFSDFFLEALADGATFFHSYIIGHGAATQSRPWQSPSIDANGNSIPNEDADYVLASMRGLPYEQPDEPAALTNWGEPFIVNISDTRIESGSCIIEATVRDDLRVRRVWSVIYKPGYEMPINDGSLASDTESGAVTVDLIDQGNDRYRVVYEDCSQRGRYRIVVNADDDGGLQARPVGKYVANAGIFLPLILK